MAEHIDHVALMMGHSSSMGHSMHMGGEAASSMAMEPMCKMSMLANFDWPLHRCVVFSSWHPKTNTDVWLTLLALVFLSAAFEYLRWRIRAIDSFLALELASQQQQRGGGRHVRKASVLSGGAAAAHGRTGSTTSGLLTNASMAAQRSPGRAGSSSSHHHTALDMSTSSSSGYDQETDTLIGSEERGHGDDDGGRHHARRTSLHRNASTDLSQAGSVTVFGSLFCRPRTLRVSTRIQLARVVLYGLNVAVGAFLMLVLMSYNSWLIGATVVGAMLGFFFCSRDLGVRPGHQPGQAIAISGVDADKGLACH